MTAWIVGGLIVAAVVTLVVLAGIGACRDHDVNDDHTNIDKDSP